MAGKRKGHRGSDATLPASFDETMRELRTVAEALEAGDGGLEDAVVLFERGVALQRHADAQLKAARLLVERKPPMGEGTTPRHRQQDEPEGYRDVRGLSDHSTHPIIICHKGTG